MTNPTKHITENSDDELLSDEFLSAYVDGELTGEELAQVEQQLAGDPRAQQLVDELRALSQEIQSLPPQAVGDDLRATIMQRAERAMLLGTEESQASRPDGASSSRRWMWPAMALAAALLLTVFLPNAQQDEKPLASAKPAPDAPKRAEPRLESVATEEASDEELVAQGGGVGGVGGAFVESVADGVADGVDEADAPVASPTAIRARVAMSSVPSSAPSAAGIATAKATSKPVANEVQPAFQVFLTLNDNADGIAQFNQLLVSNGITLEDASEQKEDSDQSSSGIAAADASSFAKGRDKTKELSEAQQSEHEEVVLVEATTEQIENLLAAYNADVQNFFSIRLASEQKPPILPLGQWQQWERSGKQLAQNKLKDQNKLKEGQRAKKSARQSQLGRAMRLNTGQFQRQGNGVLNIEQNLLSKNDSPSKLAAKSPVQVLFILQKASGESTSVDGNR